MLENQNVFIAVFDVSKNDYFGWASLLTGVLLVALVIAVNYSAKFRELVAFPDWRGRSVTFRVGRACIICFVLITGILMLILALGHFSDVFLVKNGKCSIIEGPVENFVPEPVGGHGDESFSVGGVRFSYYSYRISDGFNFSSTVGGPITDQSYVRICYEPQMKQILKLEIRKDQ